MSEFYFSHSLHLTSREKKRHSIKKHFDPLPAAVAALSFGLVRRCLCPRYSHPLSSGLLPSFFSSFLSPEKAEDSRTQDGNCLALFALRFLSSRLILDIFPQQANQMLCYKGSQEHGFALSLVS